MKNLCPQEVDVSTTPIGAHKPFGFSSSGFDPFEILDGGNVHLEDREDKASSHELIITNPYHPFSWDEEDYVENVYQRMSSSFSSSFLINSESPCSSSPLLNIVNTSGSHHCLKLSLIPWLVLTHAYHMISLVYLK
jgi:hypothetical protein